ncbi:baseplate J/gp47 family protein [Cellulosilyticum sp. WCF-2]|uniref:baseplate J/gp47 family protein n=1 Tax=Cellulosilyticum sp. WCF-2 TaxID=2497860 RepID=UPI000F8E077B|nr:baseplate J/gp47 family protein [Cellulosilyticum sp. WCF-2]QEH69909.1 baseplate J/gp47 family protein [Cellulosilyticum sp. WCF-2]
MSEVITFNVLLQRMLDRVPDTLDKREGSVIYDALAPAAAELVQAYIELEGYLDLAFVDTSEEGYLDRLGSQFGVDRQMATYSIRKASFKNATNNPFNVPIGSRYTINTLSYSVIEKIGEGVFQVKCEMTGTIGNTSFGKLVPVDYIEGLANAELEEVLIPGLNDETDDSLRFRILNKLQMPATSGNIHQYKQWALEVEGVGDAKIFPLWNGAGTVKVIVVNADKEPADVPILNSVKAYIEEVRPIGATVTVAAPTPKTITIEVSIEIGKDAFLEDVKQKFKLKLEEYFREVALKKVIISYAIIGSLLLETDGVIDYSDLKVNNTTSNVRLAEEEVPVLGSLIVEV